MDDGSIFLILILALMSGFVGLYIGGLKNRKAQGFWLGFLLGPIGWIIAAVLEKSTDPLTALSAQQQTRSNHDQRRQCPFCAEWIMKEAKICRFCNREVPAYDNQVVFRTMAR